MDNPSPKPIKKMKMTLAQSDESEMGKNKNNHNDTNGFSAQKEDGQAQSTATAKQRQFKSKVCNDPIHGHIELNEVCVAVMDTPQFQRLRFIKQLGFCYFVYPGASHNRFEHCVGVYHLAGQLIRSLRSRQPELKIDDKDVLCVEIAGLCHDLGHGAFSHLFDGKFIPMATGSMDWKHEQASLAMLQHMIDENKFMAADGIFVRNGLDDKDVLFIKELINGGPLNRNQRSWPYEGRGEDKSFLYEIISNKPTGIDVDKWDYFARDCHHLGLSNNFDHMRFIKFARVINVKGRRRICNRDKERANLYEMFYCRYTLHRSAYQHNVNCAIEYMAVDAFYQANDYIKFRGKFGTEFKLSETINDMGAYQQVTDHVLWQIFTSTSEEPRMKRAQDLVQRIFERKLYRMVEECSVSQKLQRAIGEDKTGVIKTLTKGMTDASKTLSHDVLLKEDDFRIMIAFMDFGMKAKDPLEEMWYYTKENIDEAKKMKGHGLFKPNKFTDNRLRVYATQNNALMRERIGACFEKLCLDWDIVRDAPGWEDAGSQTPERPTLTIEYSAGKGRALMSTSCDL